MYSDSLLCQYNLHLFVQCFGVREYVSHSSKVMFIRLRLNISRSNLHFLPLSLKHFLIFLSLCFFFIYFFLHHSHSSCLTLCLFTIPSYTHSYTLYQLIYFTVMYNVYVYAYLSVLFVSLNTSHCQTSIFVLKSFFLYPTLITFA